MNTYKINLNDEELELQLTFANLQKMEKACGNVYQLAGRIGSSELGVIDVVNIYYYLQGSSAKTQMQLADSVVKDGLVNHLEQIIKMLEFVFTGSSKGSNTEKKH